MEFFAHPYSSSFGGFHFKSPEEYDRKYQQHLPTEEYEISFIDGTPEEAAIAKAVNVSQGNLHQFFEIMESMDEHRLPAFYYLLWAQSMDLEEAAEKSEELGFSEGTAKDWAYEWIENTVPTPKKGDRVMEMLLQYFDYDQYAHDAELNGDVHEFEFGGTTYTAEPNSV